MKILNTYDYISLNNDLAFVSSVDSALALINGVKQDKQVIQMRVVSQYGIVEDVSNMITSCVALIIITPKKVKHNMISTSVQLKRTHRRNVLGFDMVNPNRTMWSLNICTLNRDTITYKEWHSLVDSVSMLDSKYALVSVNSKQWMVLSSVKDSVKSLPMIDDINIYNTSLVSLIDTLSQELAVLLDLRYATSNKDIKLYK